MTATRSSPDAYEGYGPPRAQRAVGSSRSGLSRLLAIVVFGPWRDCRESISKPSRTAWNRSARRGERGVTHGPK